jgi:two-component system LytT family response regulator
MAHSIHINTSAGPHTLLISSIVRIEGSSNYSKIFFEHKSYPFLASKVLHWFEDNLEENNFIRTHHSHLINPGFIKELNNKTKQILLQTGETVSVSRRKYTAVKRILALKSICKAQYIQSVFPGSCKGVLE